MKKFIIGLILLMALALLTSCGDGTASNVPQAPTSIPIAATEETPTGTPAGNPEGGTPLADPQMSEQTEESREFLDLYGYSRAVVYEDRIVIMETDYTESVESLVKAGQFLIENLPDEPNKYIMIAPARITMEIDELKAVAADQVKAIKDTYLNIDPMFTCIDVYYALTQYHGDVNDLFYRLDHHWTHLGSYYAAEAFFQAANVPYITLDNYERREGDSFRGYMYRVVADGSLRDVPDELVYYQMSDTLHVATAYTLDDETGEMKTKEVTLLDPSRAHRGYSLFMDSYGFDYAIIQGNPDAGRSLLVFGNSSVQSLATWLADNYRKVIVIDTRYFSQGMRRIAELIEENGVEDVLWVASMTSGTWFNLDD